MTEREFPEICPDEALELYLASLMGVPKLAVELRRLGLCDRDNPEEAIEEARQFLPMLHAEIEKARREG